MKNEKVILLSGYSRGGTNIAWNILQSHPEICSPVYETNKLFSGKNYTLSDLIFTACRKLKLLNTWPGRLIIDSRLQRYKLQNLGHPENRYKTKESLYSRSEIKKTSLCLKSVDTDIDYTDLLLNIYPNLYFIALTRNGYAFADGHIRRGKSAHEAGRLYAEIGGRMEEFSKKTDHFRLLKFEEILQDPFGTAESLFKFFNIAPERLDELRIKSKKIISESDNHHVVHGLYQKKYWFDRDSIENILDPSINARQIQRLSDKNISDFNREAASTLAYFGYDIL